MTNWEKCDLKKWSNGDVISMKLNFENAQCEMRKNSGTWWKMPQVTFSKNKNYSFAVHCDSPNMKMQVIKLSKI